MGTSEKKPRMTLILHDEKGVKVGELQVYRHSLRKLNEPYPDRAGRALLGQMIADLLPKDE